MREREFYGRRAQTRMVICDQCRTIYAATVASGDECHGLFGCR